MNQQPDKLFRDKLEGFQSSPSADAWKRVQTNLDSGKTRGLYWKIAASLLLLVAASILLFKFAMVEPDQSLAENKINAPLEDRKQTEKRETKKKEDKESEISRHRNESSASKTRVAPAQKKPEAKSNDPRLKQRQRISAGNPVDEEKTALNSAKKDSVIANDPLPAMDVNHSVTVAEQSAPSRVKGVKLVFSANEVNEKYLNKEVIAQATNDDKKESTLKKVLDKASELTNNQDPIGELRQMKNEILARNFRSEKERSQNR